jgi:hypothetical protein
MAPPEITQSKRHWVLCVPDIVLTIVVIVLAGGGSHFIQQVEYWGGLHSRGVGQSFLLALTLKPLIVLITLVVAFLAVVRLALGPHTLTHIFLRIAFPVICLFALHIPIEQPGPLAAIYLQGFEQRVLKNVDIDAIQQWLTTEGVKHAGREYRHNFPPDLPTCLVEFDPWFILFSQTTPERGVTIEFRWYVSHGENYGLVIGPPSMETPETGVIELPDGFNEFRRPVKSGAYVFARG